MWVTTILRNSLQVVPDLHAQMNPVFPCSPPTGSYPQWAASIPESSVKIPVFQFPVLGGSLAGLGTYLNNIIKFLFRLTMLVHDLTSECLQLWFTSGFDRFLVKEVLVHFLVPLQHLAIWKKIITTASMWCYEM